MVRPERLRQARELRAERARRRHEERLAYEARVARYHAIVGTSLDEVIAKVAKVEAPLGSDAVIEATIERLRARGVVQ